MEKLVLKEKILVKGIAFDIKIQIKENAIDYVTREIKNMVTFSISAMKKGVGTGQIGEKLREKLESKKFNPYCTIEEKRILSNILDMWEIFHLNDLKAGVVEQEIMLHCKKNASYEEKYQYLKENNMNIVENCEYGYNWYCMEINKFEIKDIIESIKQLEKIKGANILLCKENLELLKEIQ